MICLLGIPPCPSPRRALCKLDEHFRRDRSDTGFAIMIAVETVRNLLILWVSCLSEREGDLDLSGNMALCGKNFSISLAVRESSSTLCLPSIVPYFVLLLIVFASLRLSIGIQAKRKTEGKAGKRIQDKGLGRRIPLLHSVSLIPRYSIFILFLFGRVYCLPSSRYSFYPPG